MSIVLYLPNREWEIYMDTVKQMGLENRIKITLHLQTQEDLYPINKLRNIAIKNVQTSHFFMTDMDMWPSYNLYTILNELPSYILEDDLFAGIIPAFEVTKPSCDSISDCVAKVAPLLPPDKSSLIQCIKNQTCFLYREMRSTHVNNHLVIYLIRITCMRNGFILIVLIIIH